MKMHGHKWQYIASRQKKHLLIFYNSTFMFSKYIIFLATIPFIKMSDSKLAENEKWKDEVREKLISLFEKDEENLLRVLWLLDEEDREYNRVDQDILSPLWRTLRGNNCN